MDVPPKRKPNRSERRAQQRSGDPDLASDLAPDIAQTGGAWVAAPPRTCAPWHFYWCDGHNDWHHHADNAVAAIEASFEG